MLPDDEYHVATTAAMLVATERNTQISRNAALWRGCTGVPNTGTLSRCGSGDGEGSGHLHDALRSTTRPGGLHQSVRYGLTRKREQYDLWQMERRRDFDAYGR